jgi:hypothetical protein
MRIAQLYQITYLPTNQLYYGSTWKKGKTYLERFQEHLSNRGSKYINELLTNGASPEDFTIKLLLIGPVDYVCEIEMVLAKTNLYPVGLNGNAGKNIVRTATGQKKVSQAVSAAKLGKTKETEAGVASQAKKLSEQQGNNRTEKQKLWDAKKSKSNRDNGISPPKLAEGSKKLNNGIRNIFVHPDKIDQYISNGWVLGSFKPAHNKGKKIPHMKARAIVRCPHCDKTGNISQMKRWHYENCKHR